MQRRRALVAITVLISTLAAPAVARASSLNETLTPKIGPPTTAVTVSGTGFAANEAIDVYGGTSDVGLTVADASGAVSTAVTIPASAAPGSYWITLIGRRSGLATQQAFSVHANAAQAYGNAGRVSFNRFENTVTTDDADELAPLWQVTGNPSPPAVWQGTVYARVSDSTVKAISAATGVTKWSAAMPCTALGTPAVGSYVFEACSDGGVVALSTATGAVKWHYSQPVSDSAGQSVLLAGNRILNLTDKGVLFALTPAGSLAWSRQLWTTHVGAPYAIAATSSSVYAAYVSDSGATFVESRSLADAQLQWSEDEYTFATPAGLSVAGSCVYLSGVDAFTCFDPATGSTSWTIGSGGCVYNGVAAVATHSVYVSCTDYSAELVDLRALSVRDGATLWSTSDLSASQSTPFVAGGIVWTRGRRLSGLDRATGQTVAALAPGTVGDPVVADGAVYATYSDRLVAFTLPTGTGSARPDPAVLRR